MISQIPRQYERGVNCGGVWDAGYSRSSGRDQLSLEVNSRKQDVEERESLCKKEGNYIARRYWGNGLPFFLYRRGEMDTCDSQQGKRFSEKAKDRAGMIGPLLKPCSLAFICWQSVKKEMEPEKGPLGAGPPGDRKFWMFLPAEAFL